MVSEIKLNFKNNSFGTYVADISVENELYEEFSFFVPGYRFMPKYKCGVWDGKIHLIDVQEKKFPVGLLPKIVEWGKENNVHVSYDGRLRTIFEEKDDAGMDAFFSELRFYSRKKRIFPRDDQLYAVKRALKKRRCINICPTSFGKSLSIFMQVLWHIHYQRRCIIVVPTTDLVLQFENDIKDYCTNEEGVLEEWFPKIQRIFSGHTKDISEETQLVITTWQSIYKLENWWINQFDCIILDEAHKGSATCIKKVFDTAESVVYRSGWTGSLDKDTINALQAEALIGEIEVITDTRTLMDKGVVANLNVVFTRLNYPEAVRKGFRGIEYTKEISLLENLPRRNRRIVQIANRMGTTGLILFNHIKHGEALYALYRELFPERNVYMVHGGKVLFNDVKHETYEELKEQIENEKDAVLICSYGKFSTGVSIKNLHWLIFAIPTKSFVRVVQSIGRALRVSETKKKATIIDLVDDLTIREGKRKTSLRLNHAFRHFKERFSIISKQKLEYQMKTLDL